VGSCVCTRAAAIACRPARVMLELIHRSQACACYDHARTSLQRTCRPPNVCSNAYALVPPQSYVEAHGWRFPGVGEFQCYDRRALASLAQVGHKKHAQPKGCVTKRAGCRTSTTPAAIARQRHVMPHPPTHTNRPTRPLVRAVRQMHLCAPHLRVKRSCEPRVWTARRWGCAMQSTQAEI